MSENKVSFFSFIKQHAFYLILSVGLVAFLTVCIVSSLPNKTNTDEVKLPEQSDTDIIADETEKPTEEDTTREPIDEPTEPVIQDEPMDTTYGKPVDGEVSVRYSGTSPVFSETLQEWHMHQGVDYVTSVSEPVYAVYGGTVESVYDDEMMGNTVVVLQNDGIRTLYQSLTDAVKVKEGSRVEKGTLLGLTGTSSDEECEEGIHLHLAMISNGGYIDPLDKTE